MEWSGGERLLVDGESFNRGFFECLAEPGDGVAVVALPAESEDEGALLGHIRRARELRRGLDGTTFDDVTCENSGIATGPGPITSAA
jgi:hypothetical protein